MNAEVNKRTQCGRKCQGSYATIAYHLTLIRENIHKMIVQPAMLYGMETALTTSYHVKKLKVKEMKICVDGLVAIHYETIREMMTSERD